MPESKLPVNCPACGERMKQLDRAVQMECPLCGYTMDGPPITTAPVLDKTIKCKEHCFGVEVCRSHTQGWHVRNRGKCCVCGESGLNIMYEAIKPSFGPPRKSEWLTIEASMRDRVKRDLEKLRNAIVDGGKSLVALDIENPTPVLTYPVAAATRVMGFDLKWQEGKDVRKMISQLKVIKDQIERIDIEEMLALVAEAKGLAVSFADYAIPVPDWLQEAQATLDKEVKFRRRDQLEKQLKQAQAKLDALKSAEEKRTDAAGEVERLKKLLEG